MPIAYPEGACKTNKVAFKSWKCFFHKCPYLVSFQYNAQLAITSLQVTVNQWSTGKQESLTLIPMTWKNVFLVILGYFF